MKASSKNRASAPSKKELITEFFQQQKTCAKKL